MTQDEETDFAEKSIRAVSKCVEELHIAKEDLDINKFLGWLVDKAIKEKKGRKKSEKQNIDTPV